MLENIIPRHSETMTEYRIEFTDEYGNGYSFYADDNGNVIIENEAQRENYEDALAHPEKFTHYNKFTKRIYHYTEPAHGICKCGQDIALQDEYMGACQCEKCGQWYNLFGQEVLDPEYWNE